jgi:hypothetical protein
VARIWKQPNHGRRFGDLHWEPQPEYARSLLKKENICVNVCSFTFYFENRAEIESYISFFEKQTHPSSRFPISEGTDRFARWHSQRWFERLPMYLQEESKREKVLKALRKAVNLIDSGKL